MQFSLKHLLMAMVCSSVALFTLLYADSLLASIAFSATMLLLLSGLVLAYVNEDSQRAFWIGFTIFGWGYWLILHSPLLDMDPDFHNWRMQGEGPPLVTSAILEWGYGNVLSLVHPEPKIDFGGNVINGSKYPVGPDYMRIGHSYFDLIIAFCGALLAQFAYRARKRVPDTAID